jgi:predicted dienelactone hydrolase
LRAYKQLENGELPDQPITHDPRVKAAIIIDPFPAFVSPKENLNGITVPVQLWSSDPAQNADGLSGCCAAAVNQRLPAKPDYHFVENAKHYSFLATCSPKETQAAPAICTDAPGFDRIDFHRRLRADVVAFSASTSLKAQSHSDPVLGCPDDADLTHRLVITQNWVES